jgi:kynurenine formamidase
MDSDHPRWTRRPDGSNWGEFGPDDQRGRMNLLTVEKVRQGVAEVREGLSFSLSLPLDFPGGSVLNIRRLPPAIRPTRRNGRANWNYDFFRDDPDLRDLICDDAALLHTHYSTHWDALCHFGQRFDADGDGQEEMRYYNGYRGGTDIADGEEPATTGNARALGIERMAETCVQGRGVLVDLERHLGRSRTLVGYETLMRILEADHIEVEPGDMVCLHTGFADVLLGMNRSPGGEVLARSCASLDGRDDKLLSWISETSLSALIADNFAVEAAPANPAIACCTSLPLHRHCLFKLGVHLGELWHLTPLATWLSAHDRYRFLLTAPPIRLPGASGAPANPVATV